MQNNHLSFLWRKDSPAAALMAVGPDFPELAPNELHMRRTDPVRAELLNQSDDVVELGSDARKEGVKLCDDPVIQEVDLPLRAGVSGRSAIFTIPIMRYYATGR